MPLPAYGLEAHGLRITLRASRPLPHLGFHGSWARGVLGHALFRAVCPHPEPRCAGCGLQGGCAWAQGFKPTVLPGCQRLPGYLVHRVYLDEGSPQAVVDLILIGQMAREAGSWISGLIRFLPSLDLAGTGPGQLLQVSDLSSGAMLFSAGRLRSGASLTPLNPSPPRGEVLTLTLHNPLVTKHAGGDPLWPALRTRLQRLVNDFGNGQRLPQDLPWHVVAASLHTVTIPRGTDTRRPITGLKGTLRLIDVTSSGRDLLAAGTLLHAGAEAVMGFGTFSWREADADSPLSPQPPGTQS